MSNHQIWNDQEQSVLGADNASGLAQSEMVPFRPKAISYQPIYVHEYKSKSRLVDEIKKWLFLALLSLSLATAFKYLFGQENPSRVVLVSGDVKVTAEPGTRISPIVVDRCDKAQELFADAKEENQPIAQQIRAYALVVQDYPDCPYGKLAGIRITGLTKTLKANVKATRQARALRRDDQEYEPAQEFYPARQSPGYDDAPQQRPSEDNLAAIFPNIVRDLSRPFIALLP